MSKRKRGGGVEPDPPRLEQFVQPLQKFYQKANFCAMPDVCDRHTEKKNSPIATTDSAKVTFPIMDSHNERVKIDVCQSKSENSEFSISGFRNLHQEALEAIRGRFPLPITHSFRKQPIDT